ncbi:hypothetical protein DESME_02700 [Desulfitobacterium metallireducens DSM 15288]|uniref:Uncharacterized protein n=1 Tax=Desulfitobacterium metallireducens DSM 15288 TaxID=871968 RepID=W0EGV2_9FIRM|nr:hypothetical protein DESME_02700 [Desulfitobacterium metallireducens DSM 15288]
MERGISSLEIPRSIYIANFKMFSLFAIQTRKSASEARFLASLAYFMLRVEFNYNIKLLLNFI